MRVARGTANCRGGAVVGAPTTLAPATARAASAIRQSRHHLVRSFAASASNAAAASAAAVDGSATASETTARVIPAAASRAPDFAPRQTIRKILADAAALASSGGDDTSTTSSSSPTSSPLLVRGWVRTCRAQKTRAFLELTDGSCATGLQVLVEPETPGFDAVSSGKTPTGASVECLGELVACPPGARQPFELRASSVSLLGACDAATYPLQKKKHTLEFLREIAHLRPRTKTVGAALRVRGCLSRATHDFFGQNGFVQVHTPIITASDCEGAGEAFQVTTLLAEVDAALKMNGSGSASESSSSSLASAEAAVAAAADAVRDAKAAEAPDKTQIAAAVERLNEAKGAAASLRNAAEVSKGPARTAEGKSIDYSRDFFGKPAFLTVSGQLQAEAAACALGDVYTFGPTFRAENSNTSRHLAEFWMIEPEMAFADLGRAMSTCEAFVRHCLKAVLDKCADDLVALSSGGENGDNDLIARLDRMASNRFHVLSYSDAISELIKGNNALSKKNKFEFEPHWGGDLAAEHERWLVDVAFGGEPVFITDWPAEIKAFYMKLNPDGKTVAAMDLLAPKVGELAGGSQREERLEVLEAKMRASMGDEAENLKWYGDLRRYGTVRHAGFGVGFERLVQLASGVDNIRDTIPFPRYPGHAEF